MTARYNTFYASPLGAHRESLLHARGPGWASVWKFSPVGELIASYDTGADTYAIAIAGDGNIVVGGDQVNGAAMWKLSGSLGFLAKAGGIARVRSIAVDTAGYVWATGPLLGPYAPNLWRFNYGSFAPSGSSNLYGTRTSSSTQVSVYSERVWISCYPNTPSFAPIIAASCLNDFSTGPIENGWIYGGFFFHGNAVLALSGTKIVVAGPSGDYTAAEVDGPTWRIFFTGPHVSRIRPVPGSTDEFYFAIRGGYGPGVVRANDSASGGITWSALGLITIRDIRENDGLIVATGSRVSDKNVWVLQDNGESASVVMAMDTGAGGHGCAIDGGGNIYVAGARHHLRD
jgi:hypothetical protein